MVRDLRECSYAHIVGHTTRVHLTYILARGLLYLRIDLSIDSEHSLMAIGMLFLSSR